MIRAFLTAAALALACGEADATQPVQFKQLPPMGAGVTSALGQALNANGGLLSTSYFNTLGHVQDIVALGGDNTGATDACPAVTTAISNLGTAGGTIKFRGGVYKLLSGCLSTTNIPVAVIGEGMGITVLTFPNNGSGAAGLYVSDTTKVYQTYFKDLSLYTTTTQSANAAITVNYANSIALGSATGSVTFENVEIGLPTETTNYWHNGVACNSCINGFAKNVSIHGANTFSSSGISSSNMRAGILETGHSISFSKVGTSVSTAQYAIEAAGDVQGNQETGCNYIAVNYGWYYHDATYGDATSVAQDPGAEITNCDTSTYYAGFVSYGWTQQSVTNSLFYKRPDSTQNWSAVELLTGNYSAVGGSANAGSVLNVVTGNDVYACTIASCASYGLGYGFVMDQYSYGNSIQSNTVVSANYVFEIGTSSGTPQEAILDNVAYNIGSGWIVPNSGYASACPVIVWENNRGFSWAVTNFPLDAFLQTSSATPCITPGQGAGGTADSVQGQTTFLTVNTSAQTITNFLGGYYGKTITVVGNDGGNTTLDNTSTLILKASANVALGNGQAVTLTWNGQSWREIARNF